MKQPTLEELGIHISTGSLRVIATRLAWAKECQERNHVIALAKQEADRKRYSSPASLLDR